MQPIPSATLILLRDSPSGIETLIMRRNKAVKFLGGFWVFPGGAVEEQDVKDDELQTAVNAAVRETEEEAGIVISHRELLPISQWITPEGAPKRFSTWFFIAEAQDHIATADGSEMTQCLWVTPEEAIAKHRTQEIDMLPPTMISLFALQQFQNVAEAKQHYAEKTPLFFLPKANFAEEKLIMLYPGDAAYETQNVLDISGQHRCVHTPEGWQYINEIGVVL